MGGRTSVLPRPFSASFSPPRPLVVISGPTQLSFSSTIHGSFPSFSSSLISILIFLSQMFAGNFLITELEEGLFCFLAEILFISLSDSPSINIEVRLMNSLLLLLLWREILCNCNFFLSFKIYLFTFFSPFFTKETIVFVSPKQIGSIYPKIIIHLKLSQPHLSGKHLLLFLSLSLFLSLLPHFLELFRKLRRKKQK